LFYSSSDPQRIAQQQIRNRNIPTEVGEYEPQSTPEDKLDRRENLHRAYIFKHMKKLETDLKKYDQLHILSAEIIPKKFEKKWTYVPPLENDNNDVEPAAKIRKKENEAIKMNELCCICMEVKKTHGFLHADLLDTSSVHFVACETCANSCRWAETGCPVCRREVIAIIKIQE